MADIEEKVRKRKSAKKKFADAVKSFVIILKANPELSRLEEEVNGISAKYKAIRDIHDEITELITDAEVSEEIFVKHDGFIEEIVEEYGRVLAELGNYRKANITSPSNNSVKVGDTATEKERPRSNLERIKVPQFSGNIKNYRTWKRIFKTSMEKNHEDESNQLARLIEAIQQPLRLEIECFTRTEAIWRYLDKLYGDDNELIRILMNDIKLMKPLKSKDATSIRNFVASIRRSVLRMEDVGASEEARSKYVYTDILAKLMAEDQRSYRRSMIDTKKEESLESLLEYLEEEVKLAPTSQSDHKSSHKVGMYSVNVDGVSKDSSVCGLGCFQAHSLASCAVFKGMTIKERWDVVIQSKRCKKCLKTGHGHQQCPKKACDINGCGRPHHYWLHKNRQVELRDAKPALDPNATAFNSTKGEPSKVVTTKQTSNISASSSGRASVPVQKVKIHSSDGTAVEALAMIDSGSNQSLIRKEFAKGLGLVGETTRLKMHVAGGETRIEDAAEFELQISPCYDEDIAFNVKAYSVRKPCQGASTISKRAISQFPHLVNVAEDLHLSGGPVDILLGTDLPEAHHDFKVLTGKPGEPIAKKNIFGWSVLGHIDDHQTVGIHHVEAIDEQLTNHDIRKLLFQDQVGVKPTRYCVCSENDMQECKFVRHVKETTAVLEDGRIQVRMPWKPGHPNLPNNWSTAYNRMVSKEKQLVKKGKLEGFNEEVKALVEREVVVKLQPEAVKRDEPAWYLPIGEVETPEKSTKVRLVFDSAAKTGGMSLNDALEKGPCFMNSLFRVVVGWREEEIAFAGDIAKMFNQIAVHPDDQKYHRFLWRDGDVSREPDVYQWLRLSFGDKPAPDLAISAINYLVNEATEEAPQAAAVLRNHMYVDDIAGSETTPEKVKEVISGIDAILSKGKFATKEWHSNEPSIDQAPNENCVNVLGHQWDKNADTISLKKETVKADLEQCTKRRVLGLISQLWDPLGLLAPATIQFRIHLQDLWAAGYHWDEQLPEEERVKWLENLESMNVLLNTRLERCLKPKTAVGAPQLHGFSDGGEKGYGGAIFLRWQLENSQFASTFVASKALVAPLKKKTIPRLELMGCVLLSRLATETERALRITPEKRFWCDSTTALSWIQSSSAEFKPFVSARVAEIQESHPQDVWKYISSEENPADALTRGIRPEDLSAWHRGPEFMQRPEEVWPDFESVKTKKSSSRECDPERKNKTARKTSKDLEATSQREAVASPGQPTESVAETTVEKQTIVAGLTVEANEEAKDTLERILSRSSSFRKARRVTALTLRAIQNISYKKGIKGPITTAELKEAERRMMIMAQVGMKVNDKQVQNLIPFQDEDGIWKARGRLENVRELPHTMRNPIILPKNHPLVKLLLEHHHAKLGHCGYKRLTAEIRQQYWIVGLNGLARDVVQRCIPCRSSRKKSCEQQMGQLPSYRVEPGYPAFCNTALDLFGPFEVKISRRSIKEAWCCIFTCMTSRAIHLELCTDKSTDTFLMALRRFACLRGHPKVIWSDRGTNFVGAQEYLRDMVQNWNAAKVKTELADQGTEFKWDWNVPKASHMNGVVESLIKSVRRALESTCKMAAYTEEQWRTFLAEATYLINSRPLYPASSNVWEEPPITPNDLILGNNFGVAQVEPEEKVNPRHLTRSVQRRVQQFWQCWLKYFAPSLLIRSKWHKRRENVGVGDLVLEIDANRKRADWQLALVHEVFPGSDGLVRKVMIKTQKGHYERPIQKLCLIATRQELVNNA